MTYRGLYEFDATAELIEHLEALKKYTDLYDAKKISAKTYLGKMGVASIRENATGEYVCKNKTCGKTNAIDSTKCWWCEVENPSIG